MKKFGIDLTNRKVIRDDGSQVGEIINVTFDSTTGTLNDLIVEPANEQMTHTMPYEVDKNGDYRVSASRVQASDDCIVVG